jgi:adenine-specific DNA-methyltransferase
MMKHIIQINMESPSIFTDSYDTLKKYYDTTLNQDKSTYKSTNDEPTPIGCIEEVLSHVPAEFWQRTDTLILDPCCGNGNWHLVAWDLMKRNQQHSSSREISSQFVFNDTNPERLHNVRTVFGECATIYHTDFLETHADMYDMIFANPPYAKMMENGSRASKNHTMIRDFLKASLQKLKDGGYLIFLIPDNWMSLADRNDVPDLLTRWRFVCINIHGAKRWFPKIGSSFTWFVLQKREPTPNDLFIVEHPRFTRDLVRHQSRSYIPLIYNETIRNILNKTIDFVHPRFMVETSSDLHKYTKRELISAEPSTEHPYRLIHTPKQTVYSKRAHKFQDGWKVFLSTTDTYKTFVDNCGMTQSIAFIRCSTEEEALLVAAYLNHDLYVFLNNICRWGNFNNIRILQRFPKPNDLDMPPYEAFQITQNEREYIEYVFDVMRWKRPIMS